MTLIRRGELLLHKNGRKEQDEYVMRLMMPEEVKTAFELQNYVYDRLPDKQVLYMDSYQEMQEDMNNGAKLIGVFNKSGELIAYRYIAFPGESDRNLGNDINLTRRELINVAHLETTVVHPAYRGNSLQSLTLQEAIPILRNCGCEHLLCTVSPQNPYSLYNVMKNGLRIRALKKKYGSDKTGKDGIWRFILHRSLVQEEVRKVNLIYSIPLMNLERQRELIKKGYIGLQMLRENQLLNYVRFEGSII